MKNAIILLLCSIVLFSSCDGNYSYPEDLNTKQVYNLKVNASDWVLATDNNGLNPYYKCSFKIKDITEYIFTNGAILAYIDYGDFQQAMPYIRHYENAAGEKWTKTIDFDYSNSDINIYMTNSDFKYESPETMYFRVVFIW